MLTPPQILTTTAQPAAVIRLTIPRAEIQQLMGPAIHEVIAAVQAQGIGPSGPVFARHFCVDPAMFDFEVGVPVSGAVQPTGRVHASELPAARVIRMRTSGRPGGSSRRRSSEWARSRRPAASGSAMSTGRNPARTRRSGRPS